MILKDSRGGHNRHKVNEDFFKTWSPCMAYVLGFIYADGALLDVRKSSRGCYLSILSTDLPILEQIKIVFESSHPLYIREPQNMTSPRTFKKYLSKRAYVLRIGNRMIYSDLVSLGLKPRKSLDIALPKIPHAYFFDFLKGYFDGDGCLYIDKSKTWLNAKLIFTSGSKKFLTSLSKTLAIKLKVSLMQIKMQSNGAYQLIYRKRDTIKILDKMYKNVANQLYLERKYNKYLMIAQNPPRHDLA